MSACPCVIGANGVERIVELDLTATNTRCSTNRSTPCAA